MRRVYKRYSYSHAHRTFTEGKLFSLTPFSISHVNPGETLRGWTGQFIRFLPLRYPIFNKVVLHHWHFFVPYRLINPNWEAVVTSAVRGEDSVDLSQFTTHQGIPWLFQAGSNQYYDHSLKAYNLVWNKFFRDKELYNEISLDYKWNTDIGNGKDFYQFGRGFVSMFKDFESTLQKPDFIDKHVLGSMATTMSGSLDLADKTIGRVSIPDQTVPLNDGLTQGTLHDNGKEEHELTVQGTLADVLGIDQQDIDLTGELGVNQADFRSAFIRNRQKMQSEMFGNKGYYDSMRTLGSAIPRIRAENPEMLMHSHRLLPVHDLYPTNDDKVGEVQGYMLGTKRDRYPSRIFKEHGVVLGLMAVRPDMYHAGLEDLNEYAGSAKAGYKARDIWWFGDSYPRDMQMVGNKITKINSGTDTAPEWSYNFATKAITNGYAVSLDNIRRCINKVNPLIFTANRDKTKPDSEGSFEGFMGIAWQENPASKAAATKDKTNWKMSDSTDAKYLRDPTTISNDTWKEWFLFSTSPSQEGDSDNEAKVQSHYLVKSDMKMTRISPVKPVKKLLFTNTIGT